MGPANSLVSRVRPFYHAILYYGFYRFRLNRSVQTNVTGFRLTIEPGVLHPGIFRSGRIFARFLSEMSFAGASVLDVGTGSGILALTAARQGATVTAVDNSPVAVACARENIRRNGFASAVRVLQGDLFGPVTQQTFDVIVFNPPYLVEAPSMTYGESLQAGNELLILRKFAGDAGRFLKTGGTIFLILSSDSPRESILSIFRAEGYSSELRDQKKGLFEDFSIYGIMRA